MSVIRHWTDESGAAGAYYEGRLSIMAQPSMTADDGTVAVGIDAPWINQLAGAVGTLDAIARVLDRGIPDDRKLATVVRLVNEARSTTAGGQS